MTENMQDYFDDNSRDEQFIYAWLNDSWFAVKDTHGHGYLTALWNEQFGIWLGINSVQYYMMEDFCNYFCAEFSYYFRFKLELFTISEAELNDWLYEIIFTQKPLSKIGEIE